MLFLIRPIWLRPLQSSKASVVELLEAVKDNWDTNRDDKVVDFVAKQICFRLQGSRNKHVSSCRSGFRA